MHFSNGFRADKNTFPAFIMSICDVSKTIVCEIYCVRELLCPRIFVSETYCVREQSENYLVRDLSENYCVQEMSKNYCVLQFTTFRELLCPRTIVSKNCRKLLFPRTFVCENYCVSENCRRTIVSENYCVRMLMCPRTIAINHVVVPTSRSDFRSYQLLPCCILFQVFNLTVTIKA
jgi:hypothetical protein